MYAKLYSKFEALDDVIFPKKCVLPLAGSLETGRSLYNQGLLLLSHFSRV